MLNPSITSKDILNKPESSLKHRDEHYICLCRKIESKLHCHKSACKICSNTLLGYPFYVWCMVVAVKLAAIGVFIFILYSVMSYKYQNKSYFAACYSNNDCDSSIGLHCATEDAACNCPARNTKGRCNCNPGKYWTGMNCTVLLEYQQSGCTYDYNCNTDKGLKCVSNTCTCLKPKLWQNQTQTCDYNYIGCFIDSGLTPLLYSANNNSRMRYFVETCVNYCSFIMFKYALISSANALNYCFCQSWYNITSSTACTSRCPGESSSGYICGVPTFNQYNTKAVYFAN